MMTKMRMTKMKMHGMYNYKTKKHMNHMPITDEEALECLPQQAAVANIYVVYRSMDKSIIEAIQLTLTHYIDAQEGMK